MTNGRPVSKPSIYSTIRNRTSPHDLPIIFAQNRITIVTGFFVVNVLRLFIIFEKNYIYEENNYVFSYWRFAYSM